MPVDIAHNRDDLARVDVPYMGQMVKVYYRPSVMDGDWATELTGAVGGPSMDMQRVYRLWAEVIEEWDILDNGEAIPTDAEGIATLPLPLSGAIFAACQADHETRSRRARRAKKVTDKVLGAIFGEDGAASDGNGNDSEAGR